MSISFYGYLDFPDHAEFTEAKANFANANARKVAAHLGLEGLDTDSCASWPVEEVKQACVMAQAVGGNKADSGTLGTDTGGPGTGQCRMVTPGLRPGYFADAVAAIEAVADECIAKGIAKVVAA